MTKNTIKLLEELIEQILIEEYCEGVLDDMMPDVMADHEEEAIQDLANYIADEYDICNISDDDFELLKRAANIIIEKAN